MEKSIKINISRDFSRYPGLRYVRLSDFSGELFREEKLLPALKKGVPVVVELDGTAGYGSSFLEESFGGAIREGIDLTADKNLSLVSDDKDLVAEIWGYIKEAKNKMKNGA